MASRHPKQCRYCGNLTTLWTDDHVVPECLWAGNPPDKMVTVKTCQQCNNWWSRDEGYFRSVLAAMADEAAHPMVSKLIRDGLLRHLAKDAKLRQSMIGRLTMRPRILPNGLYAGLHPTFPIETPRIHTVIGKIVRGLFATGTAAQQKLWRRDVPRRCLLGK